MLKTLALIVAAGLALLLIYAATRPDSFRIERSARIQASPDKVYGLISDLRQFQRWNPYERKDPSLKGSYSGAAAGPGAAYAWESKEVGSGRLEITAVQPARQVVMKLDFLKPFEAHNRAEFTLKPEGGATQVTWAMQGPSPYLSKLMGLVFNMDRMVGQDFEAGLNNLKTLAEQG